MDYLNRIKTFSLKKIPAHSSGIPQEDTSSIYGAYMLYHMPKMSSYLSKANNRNTKLICPN